jgi:hypothetical protein
VDRAGAQGFALMFGEDFRQVDAHFGSVLAHLVHRVGQHRKDRGACETDAQPPGSTKRHIFCLLEHVLEIRQQEFGLRVGVHGFGT